MQLDVQTYDYRWGGEHLNKIIDIDYSEMCQIHETVAPPK